MALYPFDTQLVVTAGNSDLVVPSAAITIYAPSDTNMNTPLVLVDAVGLQIPNPLISSPQGFVPAFQATMPQVMWSGGGHFGYMNSYTGMRDAALAAQRAAEDAASKATSNLPGGGSDGQILGRVGGTPAWIAPPSSSVSASDVDTIVGNAVLSGTGATVGALDSRYRKTGAVPVADMPAGATIVVRKTGSTWPARPTTRSDITVIWVGATPDPVIISSGTGGALNNVDIRMVTS